MSAALRSFETQWRSRKPDVLQPIREQAMQRFLKLGLPSQRDETWRYTDLRSLAAQSYGEAGCAAAGEISRRKRKRWRDERERIVVLGECRTARRQRSP